MVVIHAKTAKKFTKKYDARVKVLFCPLNPYFFFCPTPSFSCSFVYIVKDLLKLWAYLRKSFDALKCLLMHQPMIVTNQRGEHACNVAQNCRLRKFHISTIFACAKRFLMVLTDLICKKNKFTVFSLTFKRLSPTYIICFTSSSASFAQQLN